jgi:hypothetical protein
LIAREQNTNDVASIDAPDDLQLVQNLNGRKILIRGNHDVPHSKTELLKYFEHVIADGDGLKFEYKGIELYATHYPTAGFRDRFNLVGHVHGAWRCQLNMLNVGVDNFYYSPCHIDRVPFFFDAINNHFDRDVFAPEASWSGRLTHELSITRYPKISFTTWPSTSVRR